MGLSTNLVQEKFLKEQPRSLTLEEIELIRKDFSTHYKHSIALLEPKFIRYLTKIDITAYELMLETMGLECKVDNRIYQINALATQAALFLVNKIVYYFIIQAQLKKNYSITLPDLFNRAVVKNIRPVDRVEQAFTELITQYECAPLFVENQIFSEIFVSAEIDSELEEILMEMAAFPYFFLSDGTLFELFQAMIPKSDQKSMGQIYTPEKVAKFMVKIAVQRPDLQILDPACGCGVLLTQFYKRLKKVSAEEGKKKTHRDLLSQIWGVELNPFPAHLAMMGLALSDPSGITDSIGVLLEDFLNIGGLKKYFVHSKDPQTGKKITLVMPRLFDAIIANPPYIKQERISNKADLKRLLPEFARYQLETFNNLGAAKSNLKISQKMEFNLTGKTDLYGYFLWHSTFFLKEHGILCFIIPNKWMDVQYGEKIKEFLVDHYRIDSIISFSQNQFDMAQVSTVILLAFRESNSQKRKQQIVRFFQVNDSEDLDDFVGEIQSKPSDGIISALQGNEYLFERAIEKYSCTYIRQENLGCSEKWSFKFLFQSHFTRVLHDAPLISMDNGEITRVVGGIKTGANEFFFPKLEEITAYGIEHEFLKPGIKSGRNIPFDTVLRHHPDYFLSIPPQINLNQFHGIKQYISQSEQKKKYHERPSVNWRPWYAIPEERQDCPDILFLRHIDSNFRAKWNQNGCIVADGVRGINVLEKNHIKFYLGVCNSTLFYWLGHIFGRWEGQGDLQLLVYELRKFLIPDVRKIPIGKIHAVEQAIDLIIRAETKLGDNKRQKKDDSEFNMIQEQLDKAVLECLNLSDYYHVLKNETATLERMRLTKTR